MRICIASLISLCLFNNSIPCNRKQCESIFENIQNLNWVIWHFISLSLSVTTQLDCIDWRSRELYIASLSRIKMLSLTLLDAFGWMRATPFRSRKPFNNVEIRSKILWKGVDIRLKEIWKRLRKLKIRIKSTSRLRWIFDVNPNRRDFLAKSFHELTFNEQVKDGLCVYREVFQWIV